MANDWQIKSSTTSSRALRCRVGVGICNDVAPVDRRSFACGGLPSIVWPNFFRPCIFLLIFVDVTGIVYIVPIRTVVLANVLDNVLARKSSMMPPFRADLNVPWPMSYQHSATVLEWAMWWARSSCDAFVWFEDLWIVTINFRSLVVVYRGSFTSISRNTLDCFTMMSNCSNYMTAQISLEVCYYNLGFPCIIINWSYKNQC